MYKLNDLILSAAVHSHSQDKPSSRAAVGYRCLGQLQPNTPCELVHCTSHQAPCFCPCSGLCPLSTKGRGKLRLYVGTKNRQPEAIVRTSAKSAITMLMEMNPEGQSHHNAFHQSTTSRKRRCVSTVPLSHIATLDLCTYLRLPLRSNCTVTAE